MSKYINKDKLLDQFAIEQRKREMHGQEVSSSFLSPGQEISTEWFRVEEIVDFMPTVEIIRCRDCKYMIEHYDTDGNAPYWICSEWDSGTDYNGYCHNGAKRMVQKNDYD